MKKFIIFTAMLVALPSYALCSIEEGAEVCSVPGFREKFQPIYNPQSNINEFSGSPEARLNPAKRTDFSDESRNFTNNNNNFNYNTSCQFGVCMQKNNKPIFNQLN